MRAQPTCPVLSVPSSLSPHLPPAFGEHLGQPPLLPPSPAPSQERAYGAQFKVLGTNQPQAIIGAGSHCISTDAKASTQGMHLGNSRYRDGVGLYMGRWGLGGRQGTWG